MLLNTFHLTPNDIAKRTPKHLMKKISPNISFLILHGNSDTRVSVSHGYSFGKKCQKYNRKYKLIIFPNGDHDLSQFKDEVAREVIEWLEKTWTTNSNSNSSNSNNNNTYSNT